MSWLEKNPKKTWTIFILGFLLITFLLISLLEIISENKLGRDTIQMNASIRVVRFNECPPNMSKDYYLIDEETNTVKPTGNIFESDDQGFIKPSKIYDEPDVSIVFIGGSTSACSWIQPEKRIPYLAGRMIEENTGKKINAYNGAVDGNHTFHSINILMNKIIGMSPDMVVMMHNINDINVLLYTGSYWNESSARSLIHGYNESSPNVIRKTIFKDAGLLYDFFPALYERGYYLYLRLTGNNIPKVDEWGYIRGTEVLVDVNQLKWQFERAVETFVLLCKIWDIEPVLMTQVGNWPEDKSSDYQSDSIFSLTVTNDYAYVALLERLQHEFNDIIRKVALEHEILLIDLEDKIENTADYERYLVDPVHFNQKGTYAVSKLIADKLAEQINPAAIRDTLN